MQWELQVNMATSSSHHWEVREDRHVLAEVRQAKHDCDRLNHLPLVWSQQNTWTRRESTSGCIVERLSKHEETDRTVRNRA